MPKAEGMDGSFEAGKGQRGEKSARSFTHSLFKKSTLGGTLFAFASMLIGNWLDKKLSQRKEKRKTS
jgi:hypothetical protein